MLMRRKRGIRAPRPEEDWVHSGMVWEQGQLGVSAEQVCVARVLPQLGCEATAQMTCRCLQGALCTKEPSELHSEAL